MLLNSTKKMCLTLGAIIAVGVVVILFLLIFYVFLTTPTYTDIGQEALNDEAAFFLERSRDSNLSSEMLDFYSQRRSERLVEWINLNPDSPWTGRLNPSAVGMDRQNQAEVIDEALTVKLRKHLIDFNDLIDKDFRTLYERHLDGLETPRNIPSFFNAALRWPKCWVNILRARNQGGCGSCWAVSAIAVISDRVCIASKGRVTTNFSVEQIIECCPYCGSCNGTVDPLLPFLYWFQNGVVEETCYPNTIATDCGYPCKPESFHLAKGLGICSETCTNPARKHAMAEFKKRRASYVYRIGNLQKDVEEKSMVSDDDETTAPTLFELHTNRSTSSLIGAIGGKKPPTNKLSMEKLLKREIMTHGPVVLCFSVFEGFLHYYDGVYDFVHHDHEIHVYDHCVKVIGWGDYHNSMTDSTEKYLLAVNSWSAEWGAKDGTFKVDLGALGSHRADFYAGIPQPERNTTHEL